MRSQITLINKFKIMRQLDGNKLEIKMEKNGEETRAIKKKQINSCAKGRFIKWWQTHRSFVTQFPWIEDALVSVLTIKSS